jgi:hypothetical protein
MNVRFVLAVVVMILAGTGTVASIWHGAWFTAACGALMFVIAMVEAFRWAMALMLASRSWR